MKFTWTRELPKIAGYYWFRPARFPERRYWDIIRITEHDIESGYFKGIDNEWAGPIPEPTKSVAEHIGA